MGDYTGGERQGSELGKRETEGSVDLHRSTALDSTARRYPGRKSTTVMAIRRQQFRGVGASTRRARQWSVINVNASLAGAATVLVNLTTALEAALSINANNWTASALRLKLVVVRTASGNAADFNRLMWGVGWFNNDAVVAGAASLPDPSADNADWYAHGAYAWHASGTGAQNQDQANTQTPVESDSMRKQRENNSSLMLIINSVEGDTTVQVFIRGSVLFVPS